MYLCSYKSILQTYATAISRPILSWLVNLSIGHVIDPHNYRNYIATMAPEAISVTGTEIHRLCNDWKKLHE